MALLEAAKLKKDIAYMGRMPEAKHAG